MVDYYRSPYRTSGGIGGFFRTIPFASRALIVACLAVYVVQLFVWLAIPAGTQALYLWFGLTPALFIRGFLHQAVTYMFLHGGLGHLGFNMFSLWIFGSEMERFWGLRRFLTYYAVCGIGAALTTVAVGPNSPYPTVGASGAILGLVLAYGLIFPDRTILFNFFIPMRARHFVILVIVLQFFILFGQNPSRIAVFAHLGGMLFGYLYLKRAWRIRELFGEIRWRLRRRRFRVVSRDGSDSDSYPFH